MLWAALIIATIGVVLAGMTVASRMCRRDREDDPEPEPAVTVTAHIITAPPSAIGTGPFAFDAGLAIDAPEEDDGENPGNYTSVLHPPAPETEFPK